MAEIIADHSLGGPPVFLVRDRDGQQTRISLYLEDHTLYNLRNFKVGNTICVMYAFQKVFPDGSHGVRVERLKFFEGTLLMSWSF